MTQAREKRPDLGSVAQNNKENNRAERRFKSSRSRAEKGREREAEEPLRLPVCLTEETTMPREGREDMEEQHVLLRSTLNVSVVHDGLKLEQVMPVTSFISKQEKGIGDPEKGPSWK